ncbi:MAG TPA: GPW/gp25 family protein [Cytophagales bacterium]|nr:GPW/gp25 family protein [Cytophagales bacterium]
MSEFYKYPLNISSLFDGRELPKCELGESISQNLQLIITSHYGEHRYNPSFGCEIWEMDFDLILSIRLWEEKLRKSLVIALAENEKRIENVDIEVRVSEVEKRNPFDKYIAIRRRVDILVKANITETGERYHFHTDLFLSPISYN